jgi:hypothetical protein
MTIGKDDEAYLRRLIGLLTAGLNEVCVDDGVKEMVVDRVIDVGVLVVVAPGWTR